MVLSIEKIDFFIQCKKHYITGYIIHGHLITCICFSFIYLKFPHNFNTLYTKKGRYTICHRMKKLLKKKTMLITIQTMIKTIHPAVAAEEYPVIFHCANYLGFLRRNNHSKR